MDLNLSVNSSYPTTTNCIMGSVGNENIYIDLTTSSVEVKTIVDNLINLFGPNISIIISNYNIDNFFDVSIVIPDESQFNIKNLDYDNLNYNEKIVIDEFVNLVLNSISN
jgi:hypothetical protein